MKFHKMAIAALGAVALVGTTLTLTLSSNAQSGADQGGQNQGLPPGERPQGPPPAGPRGLGGGQAGPQGGSGFGGRFDPQGPIGGSGPNPRGQGPMQGMMGGGGAAIDSDNSFLYIVQGPMLFKVSKSDLRVIGATPLMPRDPGGEPGQGPGLRPNRGGGDGRGTPPPPPNAGK